MSKQEEMVMVRMTKEKKDELKAIAKSRGMTLTGILAYCVKQLKAEKI